MKHPIPFIIILVLLFLVAALFLYMVPPTENRIVELDVRGVSIRVELAQTLFERAQGLGGRASLEDGAGMLFLSDTRENIIWMKGMKFPIDIVWIHGGRIVDFEENAAPEPGVPDEFLTRYASDVPAEFVLELPAGFVRSHGIQMGDDVYVREGALPPAYQAFLKTK